MIHLLNVHKGKAVDTIIDQILTNPMIFVFGEFLSHPNITDVIYLDLTNILHVAPSTK